MDQETPADTPPVRVRFGPGPDDSVSLAWAEGMLTRLRETNPGQFGKLVVWVTVGTAARP